MLDLTKITAALATGATSFAQRILPEVVEAQTPDTPTVITTVLKSALSSNQVFAERIPQENATWPACAHQIEGSERVEIDGYVITRTDTFIVEVVATTYASLITACNAIRSTCLAYTNSTNAVDIGIRDMETGFDDDRRYSVAIMTLDVTHLARGTQTIPACWVYPIAETPAANEGIGCVSQVVTDQFVILWAASIPANGVSALRSTRNEIFNSIYGKKLEAGYGRVEFAGGELAFLQNKIAFWRDTFTCTHTISGG